MPLGLGATRIITSSEGTYKPAPDGDYAAILPVCDIDGEIVDLCAWFVDAPGRWWLRHGDECFVLGARALGRAAYFGDPIELHATPQAWMLAGGLGTCILRWDIDLRDWFEGKGRREFREAVEDALQDFDLPSSRALRDAGEIIVTDLEKRGLLDRPE